LTPPAPSAKDNRIDIVAQLLTELHEELGMTPETVSHPQPLCIVEHGESHVLDLGIGLTHPPHRTRNPRHPHPRRQRRIRPTADRPPPRIARLPRPVRTPAQSPGASVSAKAWTTSSDQRSASLKKKQKTFIRSASWELADKRVKPEKFVGFTPLHIKNLKG
jgi:hypothetical protein